MTAATAAPLVDPHEVDLGEGTYRFRLDPLDAARRALVAERDHINGNPLDWALATDPSLDTTLLAVRTVPPEPGAVRVPLAEIKWFAVDRALRAETFHSPLWGAWRPDAALVRRLLAHAPYVLVTEEEGVVRHAVDVRHVDEPRAFAALQRTAGAALLPATGGFAAAAAEVPALVAHVPFSGERYARSTRKVFRLTTGEPSLVGASVEATAARILAARGFLVESPRLVVALYRLLVNEAVAQWWHDPERVESAGGQVQGRTGGNPLEATRRGEDAIAGVALGGAAEEVRRIGRTVIAAGKRPPQYARYIERLAPLAETMGPASLAGVLEGMLRGHEAHRADLVAARPGRTALLVEVKSTGDRIRPLQAEAALWHARDGRAGYRVMRVEHPRVPA